MKFYNTHILYTKRGVHPDTCTEYTKMH